MQIMESIFSQMAFLMSRHNIWCCVTFFFLHIWLPCRAKYGIDEMCRDQWNWASKNPYGYGSPDSTD